MRLRSPKCRESAWRVVSWPIYHLSNRRIYAVVVVNRPVLKTVRIIPPPLRTTRRRGVIHPHRLNPAEISRRPAAIHRQLSPGKTNRRRPGVQNLPPNARLQRPVQAALPTWEMLTSQTCDGVGSVTKALAATDRRPHGGAEA
jgi:hypothetical protein